MTAHVVDFDMYEDACAARDALAADLAALRAQLAQPDAADAGGDHDKFVRVQQAYERASKSD